MNYTIFVLICFFIQGAYSTGVVAQTTPTLTHSDSVYIHNVLHDSLPGHYYIVFNIKAPDYVGKVFIQPFDLGYFFLKTQNIKDLEFKKIMRDILLRGDTLVTTERIYRKIKGGGYYGFDKVTTDPDVERRAAEGREAFLNYYFIRDGKKGTINPERLEGLSETAKHRLAVAIASKLFEWRIYIGNEGYYEEDDVIRRGLEVQALFRRTGS